MGLKKDSKEEAKSTAFNELTFFSEAVHDFKQPVNSVLAYLNLAQREAKSLSNKKIGEYLERANFSSLELLDLVDDVLEWSLLKNNMAKLTAEFFDLKGFLQMCVDTLHETLRNKPIRLVTDIHADAEPLFQDKGKLRRVVINLLVNAYKYTDKGTITLKAGTTKDQVSISVSDTGSGISKENLTKVFLPFVRLTGEKVTGTGLGLAVAQQIIALLKGEIRVESTLGKGSEFSITVPKKLDILDIRI